MTGLAALRSVFLVLAIHAAGIAFGANGNPADIGDPFPEFITIVQADTTLHLESRNALSAVLRATKPNDTLHGDKADRAVENFRVAYAYLLAPRARAFEKEQRFDLAVRDLKSQIAVYLSVPSLSEQQRQATDHLFSEVPRMWEQFVEKAYSLASVVEKRAIVAALPLTWENAIYMDRNYFSCDLLAFKDGVTVTNIFDAVERDQESLELSYKFATKTRGISHSNDERIIRQLARELVRSIRYAMDDLTDPEFLAARTEYPQDLSEEVRTFLDAHPITYHSGADPRTALEQSERDAFGAMVQAISGSAAAMEQQVYDQYYQQRWPETLAQKENVDSLLLPLFVMTELFSDQPGNLCRPLGYDFQSKPMTLQVTDGERPNFGRFSSALVATNDRWKAVEFSVTVQRFARFDLHDPVTISYTASVSRSGDVWCHANWHEPMFSYQLRNFPVNPGEFGLSMEGQTFRQYSKADKVYEETMPRAELLFNNPPATYLLNDTMRMWPLLRAAEAEIVSAGESSRVWTGHENAKQGTFRVEIAQQPVQLLHHAPQAVRIVQQVDGVRLADKTVIPSSKLAYLTNGRTITIDFRHDTVAGGYVPQRLRIEEDGVPVTLAVFDNVAYVRAYRPFEYRRHPIAAIADQRWKRFMQLRNYEQGSPHPPFFASDEIAAMDDVSAARSMLQANVIGALFIGDADRLRNNLAAYHNLLKKSGDLQLHSNYLLSVEALAHMAYLFLARDRAHNLTELALLPAYRGLSTYQLKQEIARQLIQCRLGFAYLAARIVADRPEAKAATRSWASGLANRLADSKQRDALTAHMQFRMEEARTVGDAIINLYHKTK